MAAVLLQLHIRRREDPDERGVVLVLGCNDWQRDLLRQELLRLMPELRDSPPGSLSPYHEHPGNRSLICVQAMSFHGEHAH